MKNKFILIALVGTMFSFTACEKDMDSYDFSDSRPAYVEIKSKAPLAASQGSAVSITFQSREAFQEVKTLQYEVSGAYTATGTVEYPRNSTSSVFSLPIPNGVVPAGAATATATFKLVSADDLAVGYKDAESEKVTITIKP